MLPFTRWYATGTVAVTNGSAVVTGTTTGWTNQVRPGDIFTRDKARIYEVLTVDSNTQITLAENYAGTTASGQTYGIVRCSPQWNDVSNAATKLAEYLDAIAALPLTTKGDLFSFSSVNARLAVGTNGYCLAADSTTATGLAWVPRREMLLANRTYYVRADGSNSNTGLVDSAVGAFLTLQKAWDTMLGLDLNGFTCTIQVRAGTYAAGISTIRGNPTGTIVVTGDTATPDNVIISASPAFNFAGPIIATISGFKCSGATTCYAASGAVITHSQINSAGTSANAHYRVDYGGTLTRGAGCTVSGGGVRHLTVQSGGVFQATSVTTTITGTPNFSGAFAYVADTGVLSLFSTTWSGSATGSRYLITTNGLINTFGGGTSLLPGNSAGTTSTGGEYA